MTNHRAPALALGPVVSAALGLGACRAFSAAEVPVPASGPAASGTSAEAGADGSVPVGDASTEAGCIDCPLFFDDFERAGGTPGDLLGLWTGFDGPSELLSLTGPAGMRRLTTKVPASSTAAGIRGRVMKRLPPGSGLVVELALATFVETGSFGTGDGAGQDFCELLSLSLGSNPILSLYQDRAGASVFLPSTVTVGDGPDPELGWDLAGEETHDVRLTVHWEADVGMLVVDPMLDLAKAQRIEVGLDPAIAMAAPELRLGGRCTGFTPVFRTEVETISVRALP